MKNRPKIAYCVVKSPKILATLWAIAVAEHDGIQTRYKFNTVSNCNKTANKNAKNLTV